MTQDKNPPAYKELGVLADGERAIAQMEAADLTALEEVHQLAENIRAIKRSYERATRLYNAKAVLFWELMSRKNEVTESAEARGKTLGVRKDKDGIPVVVEFDPRDDEPPEFIKRMLGLG